jgi:hypothetical protein
VFDYPAVESGIATVSWYARQAGQRILIGTGGARVTHVGSTKLKLELTGAGRRVLASARHVHVSATARFIPRGKGPAERASANFTLS